MSEEFELIRCEKKLKLFSYPVNSSNEKELKTDFFIGKNDIWHNGIHFNTEKAVQSISDGEIVAYRISDSYKSKDFDIEKLELLEKVVSYALIDPFYRPFFCLCFVLTNGVYKLKNNASDKEKEQALLLLGKLYSDSFVLIKHHFTNSDKKEIEFFSLYNHLAPLKSLAYDEKLELFYFDISIKLRNITPYTKVRVFNIENNSEQFIPSETPYSNALEADEVLISWNINNTEYIGIINKKLRRDDAYCEIKRPDSGDKYLKEGQYRYLNDDKYILFNNPDKSKRNVKAIAQPNDVLSINYQDLVRYIQSENEDQGIEVTHPVYKKCYIYLKIDYRKKLRDFINEKVLTQLPGSAEPTFSFSYKKGFVFHNNRGQSFTFYRKKNHHYEPWRPLLPELDKNVVDIKNVMIKNGDNFTKVNIDYIPCETAINTKTGYMLIKWTINGKENTGFINGEFVRSDLNEIKRKRYPFDKANNNLDDSYSLKEDNYVLIYNNKTRNARQVIAKISKETELYINNEDKKDFLSYIKDTNQENLFKNGIKITYKQNNEKRSGYVFLDFNYQALSLTAVSDKNKTNMFNKQDSTIALFQKDVNDKLAAIDSSESIEIGDFITINCKLENSKDKIVQPKNKEVKRDTIIGYSGYDYIYQDENGVKKTERKPLPIHFETFIETDKLDFMNFNKQDNILYPGFCKIKNSITLYKGELKAVAEQKDISSLMQQLYPNDLNYQNSSSISNVCLKVNKKGQLVEGENFYEVKIIGKIVPFEPEEYLLRSDIMWDEKNQVYYSATTKDIEVYNFDSTIESSEKNENSEEQSELVDENTQLIENNLDNGSEAQNIEESRIVSTGKIIHLDTEFFYHDSMNYSQFEDEVKDNKEKQNELGIIKFVGAGAFNLSNEDNQKLRRPEFYCEKIENNEVFYISEKTYSAFINKTRNNITLLYVYKDKSLSKNDILSKPESTKWEPNEEQNVNSGIYDYNYKVIKEYPSFDSNDSPKTIWRQLEDGGTKYFCDDKLIETSESASNIELVYYDEWKRFFKEIKLEDFGDYKCKKGNRTKLFETLGITGDAEKLVCENLKNDSITYNLYFENETEWKKDDDRIEELKKIAANSETELKSETKDFDIFKEISKHFKKATRFVYFQPCAFMNHLDKVLSIAEFNPYEGNSFTYEWGYLNQNKKKENRTQIVESNPGFVPGKFEGNKFVPCKPNGLFRERYPSANTTNPYPHEGIDFEAAWGTDIFATVCGQVIHIGDQNDKHYGKHILICSNDGFIFLLGHLSTVDVSLWQYVTPKTIVAKVGNSGNCWTDGHKVTPSERAAKLGAHLHLSVYKATDFEEVWDSGTSNYKYGGILRNPFERNHRWDIDGGF